MAGPDHLAYAPPRMLVLVTGGTGLVGRASVDALIARGHRVRLLSRHARRDAAHWADGVEPVEGNVADPGSIRGAADGCDAVLHIVGIVEEHPPEVTFEQVNVRGTAHVVAEAQRAGVPRLVYVSSLGADVGHSDYHRSKLAGEEETRGFRGDWRICRPGNVYGPGDEVISLLMTLVRTLPAMPLVGDGSQRFQPVWHMDVGEALAAAVERDDLAGRVLELAGSEVVTLRELVERIERIVDRAPPHVPIPEALATFGTKVLGALGIDTPVTEDQLVMLQEENLVRAPEGNALPMLLGRAPMPLEDGLTHLADEAPAQLPDAGVGEMLAKRFIVVVRGSGLTAEELLVRFRRRFAEVTPDLVEVGSEPGTPDEIQWGTTLTLSLPLRGHVQVRVVEATPRAITLVTVEGHPLAGAIRYVAEPVPGEADAVRFEIRTFDRAATGFDWLALHPIGNRLQDFTWKRTLAMLLREVHGTGEPEMEVRHLDEAALADVQRWILGLVERQEEEAAEGGAPSKSRSS